MKFKNIKEIVNLLCLFWERNVLNIGLLKRKSFRIFCGLIVLGLSLGMSYLIYLFFDTNQSSTQQTQIVLDTYSCTVFMWTFIVFLVMKVLFIKKDGFSVFMQQLPVTRREVNVSILVFEIAFSLVVMTVISSSVVIALIARDGMTFVSRMICNVYLLSITIYVILELIYGILNYFINFFKLNKIKDTIIVCMLSLLLLLFYGVIIPKVLNNILFDYIDKKPTYRVLVYAVVNEKYGLFAAILLFLLVVGILGALIILIPNNDLVGKNNHIKIFPECKNISMFKCYVLGYLRKVDMYTYYFIALFAYIMMNVANVANSHFVITLLTFNGMYAYVQSKEVRYIMYQKEYSEVRDYFYIIFGQFSYIFILSLPMTIFSIIRSRSVTFCINLYLLVLVSIIFFTLVGILFPAKNENPFSAFVGVSVITLVVILAAIIEFVLKLNTITTITFLGVLTLGAIGASIVGLKRLRLVERYAEI